MIETINELKQDLKNTGRGISSALHRNNATIVKTHIGEFQESPNQIIKTCKN